MTLGPVLGVRFAPLFASTDEDRVYLGLVEDNPHDTYIEAVKVLEEIGIEFLSAEARERVRLAGGIVSPGEVRLRLDRGHRHTVASPPTVVTG